MSFDPRSLERLKELGRRLPQPLPQPLPPPTPRPGATAQSGGPDAPARERRHRVEIETDPEALFHELMQVSPDGTVPPHLLERLRQAEEQKRQSQRQQARGAELRCSQPSGTGSATSPAAAADAPRRQAARPTVLGQRDPRTAAEHPELYTAFQQLLLEADGEA